MPGPLSWLPVLREGFRPTAEPASPRSGETVGGHLIWGMPTGPGWGKPCVEQPGRLSDGGLQYRVLAPGYADKMPMPKRSSVDDFFARLSDVQRPHLEALRELSRDADPEAREELKWNLPAYVRGERTSLWMLQNFKNHCSLRFPPPFFATHKAAVEAVGFEAGEGFIKLPYERELPVELLKVLMRARVQEYAATGAGWNDR